MPFDRKTLLIPEETRFEERIILTDGDIIIGDGAISDFGFKTTSRVFVGERAEVDGDISAKGDVYIDMFTRINGSVTSEGNVYIGDGVIIKGKLSVHGDLDVGNNVKIEEGFEARGWINIRSPVPLIIYIFIYLLHLLRLGKSEEIEKMLSQIEESSKTIPVSEKFLFVPNGVSLNIERIKTPGKLLIGEKCRVVGNFDADEIVNIGDNCTIYGSIFSKSDIVVGKKVEIHGNVVAGGDIYLDEKVEIHGDIEGNRIYLPRSSHIHGKLFAKSGAIFEKVDREKIEEKLIRFNTGADIVDEIKDALE